MATPSMPQPWTTLLLKSRNALSSGNHHRIRAATIGEASGNLRHKKLAVAAGKVHAAISWRGFGMNVSRVPGQSSTPVSAPVVTPPKAAVDDRGEVMRRRSSPHRKLSFRFLRTLVGVWPCRGQATLLLQTRIATVI